MAAGAAPSPATQAALAQTVAPAPAATPPPVAPPATPSVPPAASDAQAQIDAANAATLAQLAGSNTAGVNAGNAAVAAGQADRAQAAHNLMVSAIMRGGPQATGNAGVTTPPTGGVVPVPNQQAALQNILGGAYDQRIGTTGDLTAAFNAANQTREAGAANYFKEATAALPIVQAYAQSQAQQKAIAAQQAADSHSIALQLAQDRLATAQSRAGATGALGGLTATEKANTLTTRVEQYYSGAAGVDVSQMSNDDVLAAAAADLGISPVEAQALYQQGITNEGTAATKANAAGQLSTGRALSNTARGAAAGIATPAEIRSNPGYPRALAYGTALWNVKGSTQASVVGALTQYAGMSPAAATLVANDTVKDRPAKPGGSPAPLPGSAQSAPLGY